MRFYFTLAHGLMTSTVWRNSVALGSSIFRRVSPSQLQSFTVSSNLSFSLPLRRSTAKILAMAMSNGSGSGVVRFKVSPSTACVIQKGDITKWFIDGSSDAIVGDSIFLFLLRIGCFYLGFILICLLERVVGSNRLKAPVFLSNDQNHLLFK